ncbi:MAG: hypothetical protein ACI9N9_000305 [Enterobacterales bacterium]|jgi:hypothetical protein
MGFQVDMSPLERSSMNIGSSLVDIGNKVGGAIQRSGQQAQQGEAEDLMRRALGGDPEAFKELTVKSPQAAMQAAEYLQSQQAGQQQQDNQFKTQIAQDTAGFVEQMHLAPPEQQEQMFNAAIDDPRFDIDEEDRNSFMDVNARKAIVGQVKGKEYADNFFGANAKPMTEYQQEMVKGNKIDRELRKLEIDNKKVDNKLKTETNAVKLNELKAKSIANEEKQFQIKKARSDSAQTVVDSGGSTLELISEIEKHPGFESAIGAKGASSLFGALDEPFSGSEAAGVGALIETLEAQNFLTAIGEFKSAGGAGSLSDNEGKKLGAALSNLTSSQSEVDFKKSLNVIRNLVKKQVSKARPQIEKRFKLEPSASNQKNNEVDLSKLSLEELKALRAKG